MMSCRIELPPMRFYVLSEVMFLMATQLNLLIFFREFDSGSLDHLVIRN